MIIMNNLSILKGKNIEEIDKLKKENPKKFFNFQCRKYFMSLINKKYNKN